MRHGNGIAGSGVIELLIEKFAEIDTGTMMAVDIVRAGDDDERMVMVQLDDSPFYLMTVRQTRTLSDFMSDTAKTRPDLAEVMSKDFMLGLSQILGSAADEAAEAARKSLH